MHKIMQRWGALLFIGALLLSVVFAQDVRESLGPKDKPANTPHPLTQLRFEYRFTFCATRLTIWCIIFSVKKVGVQLKTSGMNYFRSHDIRHNACHTRRWLFCKIDNTPFRPGERL